MQSAHQRMLRAYAVLATACAMLCLVLPSGCRSLQLPRIDPTGERIFLPAPNYTTLEAPAAPAHGQSLSCLPQPAFQDPATPPPCPAQAAPAVAGPGSILCPPPGAAPLPSQAMVPSTHLTLSPARIVAPLKSQVVLIAGVCGPNGRYLAGETVEWFLAKDSSGHFLELEGERIGGLGSMLHPLPKKVSADYAVGKTSLKGGKLINCGKRNDDKTWLREGQTWITMTSATEGVSRVTAFSPDGDSSPARQETAEIYWVDAQWTFPAPDIVRAGNQALLSTTVTRASNGLPLPGWIVRYEYVGGSPAAFGPQGGQSAEAVTDQNGVASVDVAPSQVAAGTTEVRVTVMRPATDSSQPARIPVGSGSTTITWSAPGLSVQTSGPAAAQVRTEATYEVLVSNPGDLPSSGVVAGVVVPQGMQFISADPQPRIVGDRLQWDLGELSPQSARRLQLHVRCDEPGEYSVCSAAQSSSGELTAENCATTTVYRPAISVNMSGPESAEVGQTIDFRIQINNDGQLPLRNVVLTNRFDPGLQSNISASPLENLIGDLGPGESRYIKAVFRVVAAGQQRNTVEVTTEGGYTASAQAVVNAIESQAPAQPSGPAQPAPTPAIPGRPQGPQQGQFGLTIRGPEQRREREIAEYVVTATNQSNLTLQNVQVVCGYSATLTPRFASDGFQVDADTRQVSWTLAQLPPGRSATYTLQCECLGQDPQGGVAALAVAENAPVERREVLTQIFPAADESRSEQPRPQPTPAQPAPGAGGADAGQGNLSLSITDTTDPVRRGQRTTYLIVIKNERNVADRNVALTIQLPDGVVYRRMNGPPTGAIRTDGRTVEVPPIAELRAGEALAPFRLEVEMTQTGRFQIQAQVRSQRSSQGVTASAETTVLQ